MINAFLCIGQSNMAGRGVIGDLPPISNPQIQMFRGGRWKAAEEPVHQDKPFSGEGLTISFADTLSHRFPQKQIGLIPCAMGGSSLDEWKITEPLYQNAVSQTRDALQQGAVLKGILWHQGESDCHSLELANSYDRRFMAIITFLLADIGVPDFRSVPLLIGELGSYLKDTKDCDYYEQVNQALRRIGESGGAFGFVSSAGLRDKGDLLHFDTASLREFGKRYANVWTERAEKLEIYLED